MADNLLFQEAAKQTQKNTDDIHHLSLSVERLTATVEASEKRREGDMQLFRDAANNLTKLNERIGALVGIEKDIAALTGFVNEQKGDLRTLRHDLNNISNAMQGMPVLGEKINEVNKTLAAHEAKIEALETWRDKFDGGRETVGWLVRGFWAVFGTGILAGLYMIVQLFMTKSGGPHIGGE